MKNIPSPMDDLWLNRLPYIPIMQVGTDLYVMKRYTVDMELLGLRTLIYPSDNLEADIKWWTEVLGYEPYFNEPFYAGFEVGGYELGLDPSANMADGPRTYFGVEDAQKAVDYFTGKDCTVHEPITNTGGEIVVATVKRPNGQLLGLIYNPHFKKD